MFNPFVTSHHYNKSGFKNSLGLEKCHGERVRKQNQDYALYVCAVQLKEAQEIKLTFMNLCYFHYRRIVRL
jgi:hypothetical protein